MALASGYNERERPNLSTTAVEPVTPIAEMNPLGFVPRPQPSATSQVQFIPKPSRHIIRPLVSTSHRDWQFADFRPFRALRRARIRANAFTKAINPHSIKA